MVVVFLTIVGVVCLSGFPAWSKDSDWHTFGLRAGVSDGGNNESLSQYEVYGTYSLPWLWESEDKWVLGSYTGFNLGYLNSEDSSFVGSIGLGLYLKTPGRRFVLSGGVYPTYLDESELGDDDFGGSFQFTSAVGLNYNLFESWTVGYRFQHMSNAGSEDENPGLNLHMLEIGHRF